MTTVLVDMASLPLGLSLASLDEITPSQFSESCQANRDLRIERSARGEIIIMPPTFSDTGNRSSKLLQQLANWSDEDGTGETFDSSSGFTLPNGATRSPDAAWIGLERWNALTENEKSSFAPICSDFVVELRSASDRLVVLQEKMTEYIANGTLLGWLIDRLSRQVYVYRPNRELEIINEPEAVSANPELPGFVLKMAKIW